ncbi:fucose-specific lectin [Kalaharituber pfeilii]|nr:fucose-specific lectin [Kalaharituber pfeilii]
MTSPIKRTATAAIAFGNVHLRVYFQDKDGWVRESQWDGSWTGGGTANRLFKAKINTPLAAVTWGSSPHIRVYYVDDNDTLQEHCWDSSWYHGALGNSNVKVSSNSKIGACTWSATPSIRVYYQEASSTTLREYGWDGSGWYQGAFKIDHAIDGSSIAAVALRNQASLRIYYQTSDLWIREHCWEGHWTAGHNLTQAPGCTTIGAITWSSDPQIRVYFHDYNGGILENAYSGGWNTPVKLTNALRDTYLSVCCWGSVHIRIYYQEQPQKVQEYCWDNRWASGATVPTS